MVDILLADDHGIVRDGLRTLIGKLSGFRVVAEARNGEEAVRLARKTSPGLVIMDISMPELNGIDAARRILSERPATIVIFLSMHSDRRFVRESLMAGARGYILKESAFEELETALRAVMQNRFFLSPAIDSQVLESFLDPSRRRAEKSPSDLSVREREVLRLYANGRSTKAIADELSISVKTVETHRANIMDKLGIHNIAELTKYAVREGIASIDLVSPVAEK